MADFKIVVIKDGKPTNLASGDTAVSAGLKSDGDITAVGTLTAATGSAIGNLTLADGSITDSSGAISFGADNISTTGTLGAGVATLATGSAIGNLTLADGSITDSSGAISFGADNISTTGTLGAGVATLATGSAIGNLTLADGSITDSSGAISFGADNISTTGTLGAGVATLATGSAIGNLTLADGSITDSSGAISFGADNISTTGTLGAGVATLATGSAIGNLTLADGSITDSSGAISFGADNISTTGTLGAGVATLATGSTIGNLTLADGSITDSSGAISFGSDDISTTGGLSVSGNAQVGGNLTVAGDIISRGAVDIVIQDQFLELGNGNTDENPSSGGYTLTTQNPSGISFVTESFSGQVITLTEEGDASPTYKTATIEITGAMDNDESFGIDNPNAAASVSLFTFGTDFTGADIQNQGESLATAIAGNANFEAVAKFNGTTSKITIQWTDVTGASAGAVVFNQNAGTGTATTTNFGQVPSIDEGTIIMISGLTGESANDGLYGVQSTSAAGNNGTITVQTSAQQSPDTPFTQTTLTDATDEGLVTFVDLYVQIVSDGVISDSSGAIAVGTLSDIYAPFAQAGEFTGGYSIVGASAVSVDLQDAYDLSGQVATSPGNDVEFIGSAQIDLSSSQNGPVSNVGQDTQSGSVNIIGATNGGDKGSVSVVSTNDMAISMVTDLSAEATLTIGAYTPSGANPDSQNNVVIKGDEVSVVSRFTAGENISASDTLAFGNMVTEAELDVTSFPEEDGQYQVVIGGSTYTISFPDGGGTDAVFSGSAPTFTANIDRSVDTDTDAVADALSTLFDSLANHSSTVSGSVTTITVDAGGTNETDMALSIRLGEDLGSAPISFVRVNQEAVVVKADAEAIGFGYNLAGVNRDTVSGANQGETVEVEFAGIVTCDTTNGGSSWVTGSPVYLNSGANAGFITSEAPTSSGFVVYQVGILLQYDSGSNSALVMLQPQFITEIA